MKKKEFSEFKTKNQQELKKKIEELKKEEFETSIQLKMGKIKNVRHGGQIRKDIARIKTLINQMEVKNAAS